jgi:hypothetical protein
MDIIIVLFILTGQWGWAGLFILLAIGKFCFKCLNDHCLRLQGRDPQDWNGSILTEEGERRIRSK